ncbi:MAG: lipid IV(A) 3-deoxy-D-manno-octulosonic acid transferase [Chromatiaceae bacterium]|jgi:3-deoxy-D-manno-octulosonic-acid transferase|nr:lipid IV(A) 3-deoxy-D-manno-octulosonic acid transferase [Chromatiaceae bacterium]
MARLYILLLYLLLPLALVRLLWRSRRSPGYRERWRERLGLFGDRPLDAAVWVHAVSVGEVQAAAPLLRHLIEHHPRGVVVTTTTPTGAQRLRDLFDDRVRQLYTPYDLPPVMGRFLNAVRPDLVLVMETEIWPNMVGACAARDIPVVLANARLSPRSAQGYARLGGLTRETFGRFAAVAAQGNDDAARFRALGVPAERVEVTGNLKFDLRLPASLVERAEVMRRDWGAERPVWVAASTHEGEEEQVLAAHREIRSQRPDALLVLVPRHPERFERVAGLVARQGLVLARRSAHARCTAEVAVYLGDTMGELPVLLAAGDAAFIGGSLVPVGGHNLLEAAAAGIPVAIGPEVFNFAEITALLVAERAAVQVSNAAELARVMTEWLGDAALRARIGENGRRVVEHNRGALDRLLALIDRVAPAHG